jgi:ectoine hydroxylase-related dioxygenase (phytanoyl-CoA dioxygenase family)
MNTSISVPSATNTPAISLNESVVSQETIEQYRKCGATIVRGLFSPEEVSLIASGIERVLSNPSKLFQRASSDTDSGSFVEDFCRWSDVDEFLHFAFHSKAADVAGTLMGSTDTVRLYHDHILVKEPNTVQETPWHQDQPYYNILGSMNASMWMPVDPVPIESTLEFLEGSHLQGWMTPRTFLDGKAKWFPEGELKEIPEVEADRYET